MRACISTSDLLALAVAALLAAPFAAAPAALAADNGGGSGKDEKAAQPEDDDYSGTPFTDYGNFNEDAEEAAETRFYQYGRFFGVSLGLNYEGLVGNRAKLWEGGFPGIDFRVHYWFDFSLALEMGFYSSPHSFESDTLGGANEVRMTWIGLNLKYYFDTKNLSSGITFASPFVLLGFGTYTKTQTPQNAVSGVREKETKFAPGLGAGIEFAISPRKSYFVLDGKLHFPTYKDDSFDQLQGEGIPNLKGFFYTFTGSILFTW